MNSGLQSYVEWMVRARWGQVPADAADPAGGPGPAAGHRPGSGAPFLSRLRHYLRPGRHERRGGAS
ncbi:hypothetical protein [Sphaerisporangium dianthi]|uniref:Uncharacterized protein n=1 Tax=Sphaerisporangium dianthi TaxID=1436120 RepID=A0ABV9CRC6_9ACTN